MKVYFQSSQAVNVSPQFDNFFLQNSDILDYSLELPSCYAMLEMGSSSGRRLHHSHEARRTDTIKRPVYGQFN